VYEEEDKVFEEDARHVGVVATLSGKAVRFFPLSRGQQRRLSSEWARLWLGYQQVKFGSAEWADSALVVLHASAARGPQKDMSIDDLAEVLTQTNYHLAFEALITASGLKPTAFATKH
jgi:hypothetical protein